jgi:hypothetical protein
LTVSLNLLCTITTDFDRIYEHVLVGAEKGTQLTVIFEPPGCGGCRWQFTPAPKVIAPIASKPRSFMIGGN